jgi:hypothetical protein
MNSTKRNKSLSSIEEESESKEKSLEVVTETRERKSRK